MSGRPVVVIKDISETVKRLGEATIDDLQIELPYLTRAQLKKGVCNARQAGLICVLRRGERKGVAKGSGAPPAVWGVQVAQVAQAKALRLRPVSFVFDLGAM